MKKLSLLLVVLVVLSLFAACGPKGETGANSAKLNELEAKYVGSETPVELAVDGASNYVLVRPKTAPSEIVSIAAYAMKQLKTTFGGSFSNNTDDKEDFGNEILIGETNRKESGYAKELLLAKGGRINDWLVAVMGQKIVIYGMSPAATKAAGEYFLENIAKQSSVDQKLCYYNVADSSQFTEIKLGDTTQLLKFKLVRARYNVSYYEQKGLEDLAAAILEKTGYEVEIVKDELSEPTDYEIILGETTREGEEAVSDYDTYTINPVGNKIYINGGHTYSRAIAINELTRLIKEGKGITEKITGSYAQTSASYGDDFYKLTWKDEFDASAIDTSIWCVTDKTSKKNRGTSRGDGMKSYRMIANTYLKDGCLYEVATYDDQAYYGSYIQNHGNMWWKLGFTEASMVIPYGVGLWSCYWNTTANEDGSFEKGLFGAEINVMECHGSINYAANYHRWPTELGKAQGKTHDSLDNGFSNAKRAKLDEEEYFYTDFHTVGFYYDMEKMFWTLDGDTYFTYEYKSRGKLEDDLATIASPLSLKFTYAVGFQGDPIKGAGYWQESNKFITNYVHIFQNNTGSLKVMPNTVQEEYN